MLHLLSKFYKFTRTFTCTFYREDDNIAYNVPALPTFSRNNLLIRKFAKCSIEVKLWLSRERIVLIFIEYSCGEDIIACTK